MLNPFSLEAREIVKKSGAIDDLPSEIFELAKRKVSWKDKQKRPPKEILELPSEADVLSYYILFLAAGLNFSPYSNEVKLVKEAVYQITRERLMELAKQGETSLLSQVRDRFDVVIGEYQGDYLKLGSMEIPKREIYSISQRKIMPQDRRRQKKYGVPWKTLLPLLKAKEMKLSDWDIRGGYIILSLYDMVEAYSRLIAVEALEEMISLRKPGRTLEIERLDEIVQLLSKISKTSYRVSVSIGKAGALIPANFPPCIKEVLNGVSTGSRNYAVSVLLTSFLSYARAAPRNVKDPKISDFIKDPAILKDEILPLIYQAAERCQPPLFEDQPMEKLNIAYHLGLGLTEEIRLENAGASKWYFPPNCEKIQREAPNLCVPDELCSKIKNPLNYYFLKAKMAKGEGERDEKVGELLEGEIIKIHRGSGLIQRCPECNRRIVDNFCVVHSDVKGVDDLRIKATLKQNNISYWLVLNREVTEKILGFDLEKAKKIGKDAVLDKIKGLVGKKIQVNGKRIDKNFLVREVIWVKE
jgi:DNA primase large subunit